MRNIVYLDHHKRFAIRNEIELIQFDGIKQVPFNMAVFLDFWIPLDSFCSQTMADGSSMQRFESKSSTWILKKILDSTGPWSGWP